MSLVSIRAALEGALNSMSPAVSTAWENSPFTPTPGTAYQFAQLVPVRPDNRETGPNFRQLGYLQVTLRYPENVGTGAVMARAEALRSTFKRGTSLTSGGVTVTIMETPEVLTGFNDGDRYALPVRIPFSAPVTAA